VEKPTTNLPPILMRFTIGQCKRTSVIVLIFTTYNSLQRIVDAEIDVDTIYFDEAHNSVTA
jgi:predicted helicase